MQTIPSLSSRLQAIKQGAIGWLVIDNEARRNALSLDMWLALPALVQQMDDDPDIRVIVLRGAGEKVFVAGADISEFETLRATAESARAYEASNIEAFAALREARKPVIAMVHGFCLGGGMGLAAACDLRFAANDATFGIPAARLGVGYPPSAIRDIVNLVGPARAKDIFFSARRYTAEEALATGLIDRSVPADDLAQTVEIYCNQLIANAPLTQQAAKATINALADDPAEIDWTALQAMADACFDSEDFAEGRTAFLEKRTPAFQGR